MNPQSPSMLGFAYVPQGNAHNEALYPTYAQACPCERRRAGERFFILQPYHRQHIRRMG
jgi:hypothetical protein